jgi:hypothetical protein
MCSFVLSLILSFCGTTGTNCAGMPRGFAALDLAARRSLVTWFLVFVADTIKLANQYPQYLCSP